MSIGPVAGNYWANVSAMKMPAPNVLVVQLVEDGKTLAETKAFFSKDGSPILQTNLFNRVP